MLEALVAVSPKAHSLSPRRVELERSLSDQPPVASGIAPVASSRTLDRRFDELQERVASALSALGYPSLAAVHCDVAAGRVVLSGMLPSYHLKQMAQVAALGVAGRGRVDNRVIVTSR